MGVQEAIRLGAKRIVVPGAFPLGCLPMFLSGTFPDKDLDEFGCLRFLNNLAQFLNIHIQARLNLLRLQFQDVIIHYADNYNAFLSVFRVASDLGKYRVN